MAKPTFVAAEVAEIDRAARQVTTSAGRFGYDWLILAPGIREDFSAWYGDDRGAAAFTRRRFGSAFAAAGEQPALKARLENFKGGDLVMTIPPMPFLSRTTFPTMAISFCAVCRWPMAAPAR